MQRNIAVGVGTELLFRDKGAGAYLSYDDIQPHVRVVCRVMSKISAVTIDVMNDAGGVIALPHKCLPHFACMFKTHYSNSYILHIQSMSLCEAP
jgi:hypothetical protein